MIYGFWKKLKKPIFALAPMANVTDSAFRQIIAKYGKPDVFWTEFVSVDGLCSSGRDRLLVDLQFVSKERPIVAQLFGTNPNNFFQVVKLVNKLGFDGVDINMGCPDRAVVRQGAGAALILKPKLAQEIIMSVKEAAGKMPVSVKTRIGFNKIETEEWLSVLLETKPAAIIVHGRTKKEMSLVPTHWDEIGKAVELAKSYGKNRPLIIGNGDVISLKEAKEKVLEFGVDGVMIGRGVFGNPWFFNPKKTQVTLKKKLNVLVEHTKLFERMFKGIKPFDLMKKHFKAYVNNFSGARELRIELMKTSEAKEVKKIISEYLKNPR
jgi:nifR3 family TIM-barrel protein